MSENVITMEFPLVNCWIWFHIAP